MTRQESATRKTLRCWFSGYFFTWGGRGALKKMTSNKADPISPKCPRTCWNWDEEICTQTNGSSPYSKAAVYRYLRTNQFYLQAAKGHINPQTVYQRKSSFDIIQLKFWISAIQPAESTIISGPWPMQITMHPMNPMFWMSVYTIMTEVLHRRFCKTWQVLVKPDACACFTCHMQVTVIN